MKINALLMDPADNVVTCVEDVSAGDPVCYRDGNETCTLTAVESIPFCHKIALKDLSEGESVVKYGELLGLTARPIAKGCRVSHENIYSVPRDYESEMIKIEENAKKEGE